MSDPVIKALTGFTGEQFIAITKIQDYFIKCCNELHLSKEQSLEIMCTLHETFHLSVEGKESDGC